MTTGYASRDGNVYGENGNRLAAGAAPEGAMIDLLPVIKMPLIRQMVAALRSAELAVEQLCEGQDPANQCWVTLEEIRSAIVAAESA